MMGIICAKSFLKSDNLLNIFTDSQKIVRFMNCPMNYHVQFTDCDKRKIF